MKKIFLVLIAFSIFSTSCKKDEVKTEDLGMYETHDLEVTTTTEGKDPIVQNFDKGNLIEQGIYYTIEFRDDGTATIEHEEIPVIAKWSQKGDIITVVSVETIEFKKVDDKLINEHTKTETIDGVKYTVTAKMFLDKFNYAK